MQLAKPDANKLWAKPKFRIWLSSLISSLGAVVIPMTMSSSGAIGTRASATLDYVCVPKEWLLKIKEFHVAPFYRSDHALLYTQLFIFDQQWVSPPYWRFQNLLLADREFVESMTVFIEEMVISAPQGSPILSFWNTFKQHCILFARRFWSIHKSRILGQNVRNSKYNSPPSMIMFLKDSVSGRVVSSSEDISNTLKSYYEELYTPDPSTLAPPEGMLFGLRKIPSDLADSLSDQLQLSELECALSTMKPNKAPGRDGLTMEFYSKFWSSLGPIIHRWSAEVIENGQLTGSASVGVITLIPKKGDPRDVTNWRPITLLTVDVKIILKALANRLKLTIPYVIPEYQNAVPGRSICNSLAIVRDTIAAHRISRRPLFVLSVDQHKAFDRVNHTFLFHLLSVIGLPDFMVKAIKAFYQGFKCCIKNVTYLTPTFYYRRGVRQGDPMAAFLYTLALQPVLNAITLIMNQERQMGTFQDTQITAYADDVTFFLPSLDLVSSIVRVFQEISRFSEAALNLKKSLITPFFCTDNCDARGQNALCGIPISGKHTTILGITFSHDGKIVSSQWESLMLSTKESIAKAVIILKNMSYTQRAKWITIKLWPRWAFLFKILHPTNTQLSQLTTTLSEAIWLGSRHWLSAEQLSLPISEGGLGMISITNRLDTYRIKHLVHCMEVGPAFPTFQLAEKILDNYNNANAGFNILHTVPDQSLLQQLSPFYRAAFTAWNRLPTILLLDSKDDFLNLPCFNSKALQETDPPFGLTATQSSSYNSYTIHDFLLLKPPTRTRTFNKLQNSIQMIADEWQQPENPQCPCRTDNNLEGCNSGQHSSNTTIYLLLEEDLKHTCSWKNKTLNNVLTSKDNEISQRLISSRTWITLEASIAPPVFRNRFWRFLHGKLASSAFFAAANILKTSICALCGLNDLSLEHQFQSCTKLTLAFETLVTDIQTIGLPIINIPFCLYLETETVSHLANFLIMAYVYTVMEVIKSCVHKNPGFTSKVLIKNMYLSVPAKHISIMVKHHPPDDSANRQIWSIFTHAELLAKSNNGLLIRSKDGYLSPMDISKSLVNVNL